MTPPTYPQLRAAYARLGYRLARARLRGGHEASALYWGYRVHEPPGPGSTAYRAGTLAAAHWYLGRVQEVART